MKDTSRNINEMVVWSATELVQAGFSRAMAYRLLNRKDVPTIKIGTRLFIDRERFIEWLRNGGDAGEGE